MGPSPQVPPDTEPGSRTPRSPGERALVGLFAGTALVTGVIVLLNLVGGEDTANLPSPSPTLASEPPATPTAAPSAPRASEVPSIPVSFPPLESVGPVPSPQPDTDPWVLKADHFRYRIGVEFAYQCPPGGKPYVIWGTDVYTDDSSVCTAAVHAGLITLADGGDVTIVMMAGQDSYLRSTRHGIQSLGYPAWHSSFAFVP